MLSKVGVLATKGEADLYGRLSIFLTRNDITDLMMEVLAKADGITSSRC